MKSKQLESLSSKYILPHLPGFAAKGSMLYETPVEYHLRGFEFQSSRFSPSSFYLWVFVTMLYAPGSGGEVHHGDRIMSGEISEVDEAIVMAEVLTCIQRRGLLFLEKYAHIKKIVRQRPGDRVQQEDRAYALIVTGQHHRAARALERLGRDLEKEIRDDPEATWLQEMADRVRTIRGVLCSDTAEDLSQLNEWRSQTLRNLHLDVEDDQVPTSS